MLNYDENKVLTEHRNGLALVPQVEEMVDQACKEGSSNIFYIGIGGTVLSAGQMNHMAKQLGSRLPLYVENAADFCLVGNPLFDGRSLVVIESASGDTKEVVEAVEKAHEAGARVLGYVETPGTPLYEACDHVVSARGCSYYFWYTVTLRFLKNAGMFEDYDRFFRELGNMPEAVVGIHKAADQAAADYAKTYCDEPITYLVASGNLEDWAVLYGMCIMEEMLWMRTRPVSAANFFHGTLEVIERDVPVLLLKGEDQTRPEMDRVEAFVRKISAKVTVFDARDYELPGISREFRGLLSPLVIRSVCQRISAHLEDRRKHPMDIRRYYRRLDY